MRTFSFKHLGLLLLASVIIFSCCQKPVEPIVNPPVIVIPKDLSDDQVRYFPFGGDPRGTYYPNTPLIVLSGSTNYFDFDPPTVNRGSGKLVLEGNSATTGTWRAEDIVFQYNGIMRLGAGPYPISTVNHDTLAAFFRYGIGRWTISRNYSAQIFFFK